MLDWALENKTPGVAVNPVAEVKRPKPLQTGGHHSWTPSEVAQFEATDAIGTKARLALALLLFTG